MANIIIKRNTAFVESSASLETIQKLAKYRPDTLKLKDEKGNVTFMVGVGCGNGKINEYGVDFGAQADVTKPAGVTLEIPTCAADPKAYIMDIVGTSILNLGKVEAKIAGAVVDIDEELAAIESCITNMDEVG